MRAAGQSPRNHAAAVPFGSAKLRDLEVINLETMLSLFATSVSAL